MAEGIRRREKWSEGVNGVAEEPTLPQTLFSGPDAGDSAVAVGPAVEFGGATGAVIGPAPWGEYPERNGGS
jgi:hypothetical protein